ISRMNSNVLEQFSASQLLAMCKKAAVAFTTATLPLGETEQSFEDYVRQISSTTGMPQNLIRVYSERIRKVLDEMSSIVAGLTRGFDLSILDHGFGLDEGRMLSWYRECRVFGAVLPSNSPGVHGLWVPAVALKTPLALKSGREEPWTPYRLI